MADRLVLIANDADYVPAVKLARREGLTVALDPLWTRAAEDLRENVDYIVNKLPGPSTATTPTGFISLTIPRNTIRSAAKPGGRRRRTGRHVASA